MKIHLAVDITKKIKRVEWIQDRPKQEIDATRDITNEGTEYGVADLLQERPRRQSDGIGVKDGGLQEDHTRLVKALEMIATVTLSKGNEEARSPAQVKVKIHQASIGFKRSVCEDSATKDGDPDETDTVHGESRRQSVGMSTRDGQSGEGVEDECNGLLLYLDLLADLDWGAYLYAVISLLVDIDCL